MRRITYPAACVLQALAIGERYGFSIMDATGLSSGTVYQILRRFEGEGLVASCWEEGEEPKLGRPRRRYYELTGEGERALERAAERFSRHEALFRPASS
ncbi:MAG TPA: PadR family transcriptional regulator [Longimicrobiales bacterium]|jgi:DNA-binding PadR family transcriptional regulator